MNELEILSSNQVVIQDSEIKSTTFSLIQEHILVLDEKALFGNCGVSYSKLDLLKYGIVCFNQFLQANWTGPLIDDPIIPTDMIDDVELDASLDIDGESVYSGCNYRHLLLASIKVFRVLSQYSDLSTAGVWYSRACFTWQRILADANDRGQGNCPSLMIVCLNEYCSALSEYGYIPECIAKDTISHLPRPLTVSEEGFKLPLPDATLLAVELQAELIVELLVRLAYYGKTNLMPPILDHVTSMLGISIDVTGVAGIRRQYQTESFAQMAARVVRKPNHASLKSPEVSVPVPKALTLAELDVTTDMLENVRLADGTENESELTSELSAIEQCCLIAEGLRHYYSGSNRDELNLESVHAVAMRVISTSAERPPSWIAFSMCLLFRSRAEFFRNNTRGRACFQTDALVDQFKDAEPSASIRLRHIHTTGYPSVWELQRENGVRMMEVGMVMTACEMFKKLNMWPLAMDCLAVAGRKQEALELLDSLEPLNARLLVSKGDMTGDPKYYEQAWEMSKHRSARAMRSLGRCNLKESNLEQAAECFEKSLEINPLFDDIWFNLGSIYLRLDAKVGEGSKAMKEKAMQSFVRCVNVNPEHVQGWVNLSAVYSECGLEHIQEAKHAAGEAVRLSPQAWQFWENYTLISARAEDWQNVLRGEQRLSLTLNRPDHPDINMVRMLVSNVKNSALRNRLLSFLEDLVLRNKQTVDILKILADMYIEFGRYEEAFKTVTCQLKEILSLVGTVGEANSRYTPQELLDEAILCLSSMSEQLESPHLKSIEGITAGIALTVRSVPRRMASMSGGQDELSQLKAVCERIQKTLENWSVIVE